MSDDGARTNARVIPSAAVRRTRAEKFRAVGLPGDAAALTALAAQAAIANPTGGDEYPLMGGPQGIQLNADSIRASVVALDGADPFGEGVRLDAVSVFALWPLLEPNVTASGRMSGEYRLPEFVDADPDGVPVVLWPGPSARDDAVDFVFDFYYDHHRLAERDTRHNAFYGSLQPLTVMPVRHRFADGSPDVSSLMAVDGTGRLLAGRLIVAEKYAVADHPWADPRSAWPTDAVTVKTWAGAVSEHELPHRVTSVRVLIPRPGLDLAYAADGWNFRKHNKPSRKAEAAVEVDPDRVFTGDVVVQYRVRPVTMDAVRRLTLLRPPGGGPGLTVSSEEQFREVTDRLASWVVRENSHDAPGIVTWLTVADAGQPGVLTEHLVDALVSTLGGPGGTLNPKAANAVAIAEAAADTLPALFPAADLASVDLLAVQALLGDPDALVEFMDVYGASPGDADMPTATWALVGALFGINHAAQNALFGSDYGWRMSYFHRYTKAASGDPISRETDQAMLTALLTDLVANHWPVTVAMTRAAASGKARVQAVNESGDPVFDAAGEPVFYDPQTLSEALSSASAQ